MGGRGAVIFESNDGQTVIANERDVFAVGREILDRRPEACPVEANFDAGAVVQVVHPEAAVAIEEKVP